MNIILFQFIFLQLTQAFVRQENKSLSTIRIFYNETHQLESLLYWQKYSLSLNDGNYQFAFGGGRTISSTIELYQSPSEIVFISIEEDNPMIYFLGSTKFVVNLIQPSHYVPLSISITPKYSTLILKIKQLLFDRHYLKPLEIETKESREEKDFDSIIINQITNQTYQQLQQLDIEDKNIPIFVFIGILPPNITDSFLRKLQNRKYVFVIAPTDSRNNQNYLRDDYIPYQAFLFDAILVASRIVKLSQSNTSIMSIYEGVIANQYNGMSGLFSFGMNGVRDVYKYSIYELKKTELLKRYGYIDENGYTILDESMLPDQHKQFMKKLIIGISVSGCCVLIILSIILILIIVQMISKRTIPIKDISLSVPPLHETDHSKVYYGLWKMKRVCIKVLLHQHESNDVLQAIYELRRLKNERFVSIYGGNTDPQFVLMKYEEKESILNCIQSCDQYIQITEIQYKITSQILQGLLYLHKHHYYHLNLLPSNILLTDKYDVKLTDYDWSLFSFDKKKDISQWKKIKIRYSPPELLIREDTDDRSDVYMWAMNCYYIFTSVHPFQDVRLRNILFEQITTGKKPYLSLINDRDISKCLDMCLEFSIVSRPSIDVLYEYNQFHKFTQHLK